MIKILHIYHDVMNLYGEYGNVVGLIRHLNDQGLKTEVVKKSLGDEFSFGDYDFVYCGAGMESRKAMALADLGERIEDLKKAIAGGVVFLFTGNAMEMMADLGVVNLELNYFSDRRITADVIVKSELTGMVAGFVNCCAYAKIPENLALFEFVYNSDHRDVSRFEGYHFDNVFGTHIIGPVLVKNPGFMKVVVELLGKRVDGDFKYREVSYPFEEDSYKVTLQALLERKK